MVHVYENLIPPPRIYVFIDKRFLVNHTQGLLLLFHSLEPGVWNPEASAHCQPVLLSANFPTAASESWELHSPGTTTDFDACMFINCHHYHTLVGHTPSEPLGLIWRDQLHDHALCDHIRKSLHSVQTPAEDDHKKNDQEYNGMKFDQRSRTCPSIYWAPAHSVFLFFTQSKVSTGWLVLA